MSAAATGPATATGTATTVNELLRLDGVAMHYGTGETSVTALAGIDLKVSRGELIAIMGASGSGKSTLFTIAGGLTKPTSGEVIIEGQ